MYGVPYAVPDTLSHPGHLPAGPASLSPALGPRALLPGRIAETWQRPQDTPEAYSVELLYLKLSGACLAGGSRPGAVLLDAGVRLA